MAGSRWLATLLVMGALTACGDEPRASDDAEHAARPSPRLGAAAPPPSEPPREPMDDLERPVAERLAPRLEDEGLTLDYVECPSWTRTVPAELACKGYVDGVVGEVEVELSKGEHERVEFDAWLDHGVLATARLVERLESEGYVDVDCGPDPAYAARPGMEIVCRVDDAGEVTHVVAEVTDRDGAVRIEDY
jgi:hypothetical protein